MTLYVNSFLWLQASDGQPSNHTFRLLPNHGVSPSSTILLGCQVKHMPRKILTASSLENWRRPLDTRILRGWRLPSTTWNPIKSAWMKQSMWLRIEKNHPLLVLRARNEWMNEDLDNISCNNVHDFMHDMTSLNCVCQSLRQLVVVADLCHNQQPRYRLSTYGSRVFSIAGPVCRNSLPDCLKLTVKDIPIL